MQKKLGEENLLQRNNADPTFAETVPLPEMWSVYERTLNNDDRTNNYAEAAHRKLQTHSIVVIPAFGVSSACYDVGKK
ncbi:hypothetical protein GPALN_004395 [Globodera pallida]|nr:hypothetical protein GPALN_004395 [Globodera pallida]